jgi:hypothetical protein
MNMFGDAITRDHGNDGIKYYSGKAADRLTITSREKSQ